jgi:hypothetical protein
MASKATPTSEAPKQSPERAPSILASESQQQSFDHSPAHHETKFKKKVAAAVAATNLSPTAGQLFPAYVMREHAFIAQVALNIIGARLPVQVM